MEGEEEEDDMEEEKERKNKHKYCYNCVYHLTLFLHRPTIISPIPKDTSFLKIMR